jgi:hypothetical protein
MIGEREGEGEGEGREKEQASERGKSGITRMPNKEDSNDNSVSFVSPRHSINDGGNKGRLMSLRSTAADRQER